VNILGTCKIMWGCKVQLTGSEQRLHSEIAVNGPNYVALKPEDQSTLKISCKHFEFKWPL